MERARGRGGKINTAYGTDGAGGQLGAAVGGELDRVARQGEYLRGLLAKLTSAGTLTNPVALARFTAAVSSAVTITGPLPMRELIGVLEGVQPRFVTLPVRRATPLPPGEFLLEPVPDRTRLLLDALQADTLDEYAGAQPPSEPY